MTPSSAGPQPGSNDPKAASGPASEGPPSAAGAAAAAASSLPSGPSKAQMYTRQRLEQYLSGMDAKQERMRQSWWRAALYLTFLTLALVAVAHLIGELQPYFQKSLGSFENWTAARGLPPFLATVVSLTIPTVCILVVFLISPIFLVWWERKVAGHMQQRLGPMDVGGWHGWAQTIADGVKLFLKDTIEPTGIDKWVYRLAPTIVFLPAFLSFAPIPFGFGLVALNFDIGLLYAMAISGLSTVGVLMAGWGSGNKFSILGGLRAAAQIVSFEIPRLLSVVPVVMWAGTLSIAGIVDAQAGTLGEWFPRWFIFYPVIGQVSFIVYLVTTIAETNRVPFDVPEAESELVAGFHTEYGGMKFAIFFLSEYAYVLAGSLIGTAVFLGGGSAPLPVLTFLPSWFWFMLKTGALIFIFLWTRWTFPRLRVDRVMDLCWKVFIPWTLINIFLAGAVFLWRMR
jgi:NADH-quinone oxidoreductase subunit H